eukprot:TRINITY_DN112083_c0_g1_i1.p1 TRINITY_DN112083_c0_g1~~TRINITY_DN112083_c0_g1_i1.p1  ORF type:complete len:692 (-),score=107.63 TRINITY_DN112083_c0_g1_i1:108-2183(-)
MRANVASLASLQCVALKVLFSMLTCYPASCESEPLELAYDPPFHMSWSCAGDEVAHHNMREAARYLMYDPKAPLRTSLDKMSNLYALWQMLMAAVDLREGVHKLEIATCPIGNSFALLLEFFFAGLHHMRLGIEIDMEMLTRGIANLQLRVPSFAAALASTWPIFGLLAVLQRSLLRLGLTGNRPEREDAVHRGRLPALEPYQRVCEAAKPLAVALQDWLFIPIPPEGSALPPPSLEMLRAAQELKHRWDADESICAEDPVAFSALTLVAYGLLPQKPWLRGDSVTWRKEYLKLVKYLDEVMNLAGGWSKLFFSGWPLLAILHRLQEAYTREAICDDVMGEGVYGVLTRATPESVTLCLQRRPGISEERWRMHGESTDCSKIVAILESRGYQNCAYVDIGANFGSCALMAGKLGLEVLAIEPVEEWAQLLASAVVRNGLENAVTVVQAAMGSEPKKWASTYCPNAMCQVLNDNTQGRATVDKNTKDGKAVLSVSLDSMLASAPTKMPICAVKIDVEGAEEEVLRGGRQVLGELRPLMFVELHPKELRMRSRASEHVMNMLLGELGFPNLQPFADTTLQECVETGKYGEGTYVGSRWLGARLLHSVQGVQSACECATTCFKRLKLPHLKDGCRCWDFDASTGICNFYRSCSDARVTVNLTTDPGATPDNGLWAGELDGVWAFYDHPRPVATD